jgi:hypothetical protein
VILAVALARYLDGLGLLDFDELGVTGDTFIAAVPAQPDEVVILTPSGGPAPDFRLGYDSPTLQLRYRGTRDPRIALQRAESIYAALQSLGGVTLPDGTYVTRCMALQSNPTFIGNDQNGRAEFTHNFEFEVRNPTPYRE